VVAHVDLDAPAKRVERQKNAMLAARGCERLQKLALEMMRSHGIVKQPDLDAGAGPLRQGVQYLPTRFIGLKNEGLEVDMMFGAANGLQHGLVSCRALGVEVDRVAESEWKGAAALRQFSERLQTRMHRFFRAAGHRGVIRIGLAPGGPGAFVHPPVPALA
jgi:hypothetical protein